MSLSETFRLGVDSLLKYSIFAPPRARREKFESSAMDAAVRMIYRESWRALRTLQQIAGQQPTRKSISVKIHWNGITSRMRLWIRPQGPSSSSLITVGGGGGVEWSIECDSFDWTVTPERVNTGGKEEEVPGYYILTHEAKIIGLPSGVTATQIQLLGINGAVASSSWHSYNNTLTIRCGHIGEEAGAIGYNHTVGGYTNAIWQISYGGVTKFLIIGHSSVDNTFVGGVYVEGRDPLPHNL